MREREKNNTVAALRMSGWKIYGSGGAAELLGLKPTTLVARIKKMGIQKVGVKIGKGLMTGFVAYTHFNGQRINLTPNFQILCQHKGLVQCICD